MNKYKLTATTRTHKGTTVYQIQAIKSFGGVIAGDLGGWVESEGNLSQRGDCWVYGDAMVYGNAWVSDDARGV